jgi:molybdopterin/thiamine biosynthesis adenylyltransferase
MSHAGLQLVLIPFLGFEIPPLSIVQTVVADSIHTDAATSALAGPLDNFLDHTDSTLAAQRGQQQQAFGSAFTLASPFVSKLSKPTKVVAFNDVACITTLTATGSASDVVLAGARSVSYRPHSSETSRCD